MTDSVYGISNHPMVLGFVLLLSGVVILLASASPWWIIPIFVLLMEVIFIQVEQRMEEEKFRISWLDYKKRLQVQKKWFVYKTTYPRTIDEERNLEISYA
jgi:protein-S-isoprenylcysteine O-methyltransferase Ste14